MSEPATAFPSLGDLPPNPFPGLRPFEAWESEIFFGRRDQVRELLGRLRRTRFLAVVGSSGCGKSSLIRAGLLAALADGYMVEPGAAWRIACLRPGDAPTRSLAEALRAPGALGDLYPDPMDQAALEATLRRGSLGLVEAAEEAPLPPRARLFILVDQFEELFRFSSEREGREARAFVKLLLDAVAQRKWPLYVAITMRSDFLGHCAAFPGLPDAINQGLYLVPQMGRTQLREAVRGPVELYGARITERLVNRLLNDLGDDPDQLPILQHAMMRLWVKWSDGPRDEALDLTLYDQAGGLAETLSRHADEIYEGLDSRSQQIAEQLFRKITETTREGQLIRRPRKLGRIAQEIGAEVEEVAAVADQFRAPGRSFLMPPSEIPLTAETMIDISHESLIRQWKRLSEWAAAEARDSRVAVEIRNGAAIWAERGRETSFLWQGKRLAEAEEWMKLHPGGLDDLEKVFVEEGVRLRDQQILTQRESELPQKAAEEAVVRERAITKKAAYVYVASAAGDMRFTSELGAVLKKEGLESGTSDTDWGIGSTPALERMQESLGGADAVLCVISPHSSASEFFRAEIDHALKLNKRLIPILYRDCDPSLVHPALVPLQWIDMRGGRISDDAVERLFACIGSDLEWVRAHTRLLLRAAEWRAWDRDVSQLLRGRELKEAEGWLSENTPHRQPKVTEDQIAYVVASREAANRQQARVRGFLIAAILTLVSLTGASSFLAYQAVAQRNRAETQRERAERQKIVAEQQTLVAKRQRELAELRRKEAQEAVELAQQKTLVARESEAKAQKALDTLLAEFGQKRTTDAPAPAQEVQQSYAANKQIEAPLDKQVIDRRGRVRVEYFPKVIGEQVELSQFEFTLRGLGFDPIRRDPVGQTPTNSIWYGSDVEQEDLQQIVYAVLRAGIDLKYVGCFKDPRGKERVIQIGGRPASDNSPSLTVEQIRNGKGIRSCGPAPPQEDADVPPEGPPSGL